MDNEADILKKVMLFEKTNTDCPNGWARYIGTGNKCIKAFNEVKAYKDALEYCQKFKNGTLVSIHNAFQNVQVATHCSDLTASVYYYIGLNNFKNINKYEWVDGSVLDYTNWLNAPVYNAIKAIHMHVDNDGQGRWDWDFYYWSYYFVCMQDL